MLILFYDTQIFMQSTFEEVNTDENTNVFDEMKMKNVFNSQTIFID